MAIAHNLGYPRIGPQREMKKAVENYWKGEIDQNALLEQGRQLRAANWREQQQAGIEWIPVGDFTWYDHVLDTSAMLGVVPERFGALEDEVSVDTVFRMARGRAPTGQDASACEMTKWFDTNYHYIVPEFTNDQEFAVRQQKLFTEFKEAKEQGINAKPVILGPVSYLWLGKCKGQQFNKLDLLDKLIPVYKEIFAKLQEMGATWVQVDEPILVLDIDNTWQQAIETAYHQLTGTELKLMLATYFDGLGSNISAVVNLPVAGIHLDCIKDKAHLTRVVDRLPQYKVLSCGVINGRNIWRSDISELATFLKPTLDRIGDRLWIAPSCSLLHTPVDLDLETKLDPEIKNWLAFSKQKLQEVSLLTRLINEGRPAVEKEITAYDQAAQSRKTAARIHNAQVKERVNGISKEMYQRQSNYAKRAKVQRSELKLPLFPTTTIGSFPQTKDIRGLRRRFKNNEIDQGEYDQQIKTIIQDMVAKQEAMGLDVLVHGEPERNDMVEYFGELLEGFAFSANGWVQSYGSRCVKPPIIYGDVWRKEPMTVEWIKYAQSLTQKYMKGMLTGPVTILGWSFARDDQSDEATATQIALALRDEIVDLEKAGIKIIQIDEPAFREGLPLRKHHQPDYLRWTVETFKLAAGGVQDETQIHTHMCYSEFNELIESIAAMDADVITIETSRSDMELLEVFKTFAYPNEIGPGVYDIHSPIVPTLEAMEDLLVRASEFIPPERLWVNPDCGLKTRDWPETQAALKNMVDAAKKMRVKHAAEVA